MGKNKLNTLVLGLEHFIDKVGYQAQEYRKNDISVKYLVRDKSNSSDTYAKKYSADVEAVPKNKFLNFLYCMVKVYKLKPKYIEIYDTGGMFLLYVMIPFLFRSKAILIYRGGELQRHKGNKLSSNYVTHYLATKIAFRVVVKESNILKEYEKNNYPIHKVRFLHNCVPHQKVIAVPSERTIDLLFLNSIRKNRNVPFLIKVIAKLRHIRPEISVVIAGFNSLDGDNLSFDLAEEQSILKLVKEHKLEEVVKVFGFVKEPQNYHLSSKIFLFPADIVFANYSLLESMAAGCVPIVSTGEGASLIVSRHEGESLDLSVDLWVEVINSYLDNPSLLLNKSKHSIKKIEEEFSISAWFSKMMELRHD